MNARRGSSPYDDYEFRLDRDKHGVSRRFYKRICVKCKKEEWLNHAWISRNRFECRTCVNKRPVSEEMKKRISKTLRKKFSSPSYREMVKAATRGKTPKGDKHWNWKGGISPESHSARKGEDYSMWRTKIYQRDLYHCRICKENKDNLVAHHIIPFSTDKEKRFILSNGMVLCKECHDIIHQYIREVEKNEKYKIEEGKR